MAKAKNKKERTHKPGKERKTRKTQRDGQWEVMSAVLNIWVLGGGFAVALSVALLYWSNQRHVSATYWFGVSAVLLVVASLIHVLPYAHRWDNESVTGAEPAKGTLGPLNAERAWLTVKSATLIQDFAVGKPLKAVIRVTNAGHTPAMDVVVTGDIVSREAIDLVPFETDKLAGPPPSVLVVAPGAIVTIEITSKGAPIPSQEHINAFLDGPYKLYARGFIQYKDASGKSRKTLYCFKADGRDDLRRMTELGVGMSACDRWNTAE